MTTLTMQFPEKVFAATRSDPLHFSRDMRIAAAATWYSHGRISQEIAAEIAGLDRTDFLMELAALKMDVFQVDLDELRQELARD
jgi:predicted HTH domain antitoxin